jgi:hypothetical protein
VAQLINRSPLGFEAQTKKPSRWFWCLNHQTETVGFEAQPEKPFTTLVLRLNQKTHHRFWGQTGETVATSFEAKLEKTITAGFEAKPPETTTVGFEVKPLETVATGFEAKPVKTVQVVLRSNHSQTIPVVLRPNHWQTVDLGFKAQPRNSCSSSLRAWCRPHTVPPDLSIARPLNTRPVRPSLALYTRSPTPAMILVTARHTAPATCTSQDKQTWFSKRNKDKRKTKQNYQEFEFKPRQINDSLQSNQEIDHLVSQRMCIKLIELFC